MNIFILVYFTSLHRAKKFNAATKWIGIVGGVICLILSAFMIHKEQSKEATISSTSTIQDNNNLDNIKYLNDRVLELTRKNDAQ